MSSKSTIVRELILKGDWLQPKVVSEELGVSLGTVYSERSRMGKQNAKFEERGEFRDQEFRYVGDWDQSIRPSSTRTTKTTGSRGLPQVGEVLTVTAVIMTQEDNVLSVRDEDEILYFMTLKEDSPL